MLASFPESFECRPHEIVPGGTQWVLRDSTGAVSVSIVSNSKFFYSNGRNTYEMWDFSELEPRGYLTVAEINEHLKNRQFAGKELTEDMIQQILPARRVRDAR
jgi:hypothetical protein